MRVEGERVIHNQRDFICTHSNYTIEGVMEMFESDIPSENVKSLSLKGIHSLKA